MNKFDGYFFLKALKKKILPRFKLSEEEAYIDTVKAKDKQYYKSTRKKLENYLQQDEFPLFKFVEVETVNRCNNNCSFCPVSVGNESREYKLMEDELFYSIIDQLQELDYSGTLGLFSNNEPLLDERLPKFIKVAKEKLPNAYHYLFTNALLLTMDKFLDLTTHLDTLYIDNYDDNNKMIPTVRRIYEYCVEHPEIHRKIHISMRKKTEQLSSRGGQSPNRQKKITLKSSCVLPFEQLIIRPDGKISLCCNDARGVMTLGDLTKERIIDIWRGKTYTNIRETILESRKNIGICRYCDSFFNDNFNNIQDKVFQQAELKRYYEESS